MTFREALIQAYIEIGVSREVAELKTKASDAFLPEIAELTHSPVIPGHERQFIEELKQIFRLMDANAKVLQEHLRSEIAKRAKLN
jgi:hypothetical protein